VENSTVDADLHYLHVLGKLFQELDTDSLSQLLEKGKLLHIETGHYLFRQGDHHTALYIVLAGRLRAIAEDRQGVQILGDIGEGEPTGEFALFTNEPRMASVLAIRRSTVLEIDKNMYLSLVALNPAFAGTLTMFIINRMRRNSFQKNRSLAPKNIAIINLQPDHDLSPWTNAMQQYLEASDLPIQIYDHSSAPKGGHKTIFDSLEQHHGLNVLVCSNAQPDWSRQCLIYADLVVVATDFRASTELYPIEQTLNLYAQTILNKKIYLVLLHEQEAPLPEGTHHWLHHRKVYLHLHIRRNHPPDIRRFCRIITHQAVGVVLGGGGAKGFAHVGAVRALLEAGVEIDFLGGTSAGALYGIGMTHADFDQEVINYHCQDSAESKLTSNDFSFPLLSMMSGSKMTNYLRKMFGSSGLEDIWVTSYCVSTNYSSASAKVHERGPAWKMIQASIAIPGVFPPVIIDRQLHVDGGVVDNLPVEPMHRFPVQHIIAISLSSLSAQEIDFPDVPKVRTLLWDKITGKRKYRLPGITSLLINSLTLNSRQKQESTKASASLYFELDLRGVGMMDDNKWREIITKGHDQTQAYLDQLPGEERFWLTRTAPPLEPKTT
jgi:NTE family protein